MSPDPRWLPFLDVILDHAYRFALLIVIAGLCAVIALGHVKEEDSFGLKELEGGLLVIAGAEALNKKRAGKSDSDSKQTDNSRSDL